jgi:hypothetical protein
MQGREAWSTSGSSEKAVSVVGGLWFDVSMSFLLLCVGLRPHRFTIRLKMRIFSGVVLREKKVQKNQMGERGSTPGNRAIRPSFDNGQGAAGLVDGEQVFQGYTQQAADPYTNDANMGD